MTKHLDRADYGHDRSIFAGGPAAERKELERTIEQWRWSLPNSKAERKAERRVLAALDTLAQAAGYRKPKHPSLVWAEDAPSSPPLAQNGPCGCAEGESHTRVTPEACEAVSEAQEPEDLPAWELGADIPDGDPEGLHTLRCGDLDPDLAQKVLDHYRAVIALAQASESELDALRSAEARHV